MIIPHQGPALNISLWKRNRDTETVILWNSDRPFKNVRVLKSFRAICKNKINAGWIFWVFKNKFFLELYFFGDISWGGLACFLHLVQCWNHPSGSCYHNAQSNCRVSFPVYQYKIAGERKLSHFFLRLFSTKNPSKSSDSAFTLNYFRRTKFCFILRSCQGDTGSCIHWFKIEKLEI